MASAEPAAEAVGGDVEVLERARGADEHDEIGAEGGLDGGGLGGGVGGGGEGPQVEQGEGVEAQGRIEVG